MSTLALITRNKNMLPEENSELFPTCYTYICESKNTINLTSINSAIHKTVTVSNLLSQIKPS